MICINVNMLKGKIIERGFTVSTLSEKIGISKATLYRKLKQCGNNLSVKEANIIVKELNLTENEIILIFFDSIVA